MTFIQPVISPHMESVLKDIWGKIDAGLPSQALLHIKALNSNDQATALASTNLIFGLATASHSKERARETGNFRDEISVVMECVVNMIRGFSPADRTNILSLNIIAATLKEHGQETSVRQMMQPKRSVEAQRPKRTIKPLPRHALA